MMKEGESLLWIMKSFVKTVNSGKGHSQITEKNRPNCRKILGQMTEKFLAKLPKI